MDPERLVEQAARLAAAAEALPDDAEDRVAALGLEPLLRDRTLLLIEQTRMLAERSSDRAARTERLRAATHQQGEQRTQAGEEQRRPGRDGAADARDHVLEQREATARAREDTLVEREAIAAAHDWRLQRREEAADDREERVTARESRVEARADALDRQEAMFAARQRRARLRESYSARGLHSLVEAVERGWRAAQQVTDATTLSSRFEAEALNEILTELQEVVPQLVDVAVQRWMGHAHHELRQPLAVIEASTETLKAHDTQLDDQTRAILVARVRRQSMLMQRIVDQLGQATRLRSGALQVAPEQLDLRLLIEQLLDDYRPLLDDVEVTYEPSAEPVPACVEPSTAAEVLLVLLRNAVVHAPCEQPIHVEAVREPMHTRLSVHDDGAGIPLADRERAFDYGTRLDQTGTLGLGLYIARSLARAHEGDLTVATSELLGGARFDLTLPTVCDDPVR